jgi:hypothetical protein
MNTQEFTNKQQDIDSEFVEIVDRNFWEMIDTSGKTVRYVLTSLDGEICPHCKITIINPPARAQTKQTWQQ